MPSCSLDSKKFRMTTPLSPRRHLLPFSNRTARTVSLFLFLLGSAIFLISCDSGSGSEDDTNMPPGAFSLLLVNNNATDIILTPNLSWEASVDPEGGAIRYDLLLDREADLGSPDAEPVTVYRAGITATSFQITPSLLEATTYRWRVVASDAQGGQRKSAEIFRFTTAGPGSPQNLPPNPFNLLTPANGANNVTLDPVLGWEVATDPDNDPVSYDVFFGEGQNPSAQIGFATNGTTLNPGALKPNSQYSWYVLASDPAGNVRSSSTFSFTTGDGTSGTGTRRPVTGSDIERAGGIYGHQIVELNGTYYMAGGFVLETNGSSGESNAVWSSTDGVNWTIVRNNGQVNGFVPSKEHQMVAYNGLLYIFEGNRNTIARSSDGINWENVPFEGAVPDGTHYEPRQGHQVVVFNDKLYLIGGFSGGFYKSDVWVSEDGGLNWVRIKESDESAWSPRERHQVVVFKNELWLIGGSQRGGGYDGRLNDVWKSADGATWTQVTANAPFSRRRDHACLARENSIWLVGGDAADDDGSGASSEIWFSNDGEVWSNFEGYLLPDEPLLPPREQHQIYFVPDVVLGGELFILGGINQTLLHNDIWSIRL